MIVCLFIVTWIFELFPVGIGFVVPLQGDYLVPR